MALNLYSTIADIKDSERLDISVTTYDDLLETLLEAASRYIDNELCGRYFYTQTATMYFDTHNAQELLLYEDVISITTLTADTEADGTYDGETWTENTDFWLYPYTEYPKWKVQTTAFGNYSFTDSSLRYVEIVGIWGYGDGTSNPWLDSSVTGTVDASSTTLQLNASGTITRGHTIKLDDEQMYVSATDETSGVNTATVTRAVNGTTAASHTDKAVYIAQYPQQIKQACLHFACRFWQELAEGGNLDSERIGDYSYKKSSSAESSKNDVRLVASFRKMVAI